MTFSKPSKELHNQPTLIEKVSLETKDFFDKHGCTAALSQNAGKITSCDLKNKQLLLLNEFRRLVV